MHALNYKDLLLDTTVLVDVLRGEPGAVEFLRAEASRMFVSAMDRSRLVCVGHALETRWLSEDSSPCSRSYPSQLPWRSLGVRIATRTARVTVADL
ncbi:MAG: hypothetical protein ACI80V_002871 [Rhodothermales bacterium]|jgi:hypothetical protein